MRILILEDEPERVSRDEVAHALPAREVRHLPAGRDPLGVLRDVPSELVVLGPSLADPARGVPLVHAIRERHPTRSVVIVTEAGDPAAAVAFMKAGATDYVSPTALGATLADLTRDGAAPQPRSETTRRPPRPAGGEAPELVGTSRALDEVRRLAAVAAGSDAPVLIEGETGTGKEVVARAVHRLGARAAKAFVPLNCAAIPESLAESELFGHTRGAFTGALHERPGALRCADRGTLFLDEIEDLPLPLQAKLLRVVQDNEVRPLGATAAQHVDLRLLAASNRDLVAMVEAGSFRRDLFYRLRVLVIRLPPLRERREDILPLAEHFVARFNRRHGTLFTVPPPARCRPLIEHGWPGNVRELENLLESLLVTARALQRDLADVLERTHGAGSPWLDERTRILRMLDEHRWNRQRAAAALGISRVTLWRRMERHGIRDPLVVART
jgi:two-component system response regulator PilR (NtrC family)